MFAAGYAVPCLCYGCEPGLYAVLAVVPKNACGTCGLRTDISVMHKHCVSDSVLFSPVAAMYVCCVQRTCWCPRMLSRLPTLAWPGRYARGPRTQTMCRPAGELAPCGLGSFACSFMFTQLEQ
jgi:hypothetical protein